MGETVHQKEVKIHYIAIPQHQSQVARPPRDLLDDSGDDGGGVNGYGTVIQQTPSQGEMSV